MLQILKIVGITVGLWMAYVVLASASPIQTPSAALQDVCCKLQGSNTNLQVPNYGLQNTLGLQN